MYAKPNMHLDDLALKLLELEYGQYIMKYPEQLYISAINYMNGLYQIQLITTELM